MSGEPAVSADARVDATLRALWPSDFPSPRTDLYAILDGARDRRIHRLVRTSTHEWRCL